MARRAESAWAVDRVRVAAAVGDVPYQGDAVATADSYTYGATSEALSRGQAMAAWADLQAKQASIQTKASSLGPAVCQPGWLLSLPNATGLQTCVNERNVHVALKYQVQCQEHWFACSLLPRWYELHHPAALTGYSTAVAEAQKMLPRALRELGLLAPGKLPDLEAEVGALARRMLLPKQSVESTVPLTAAKLLATAKPAYDEAAARGGDVPEWITEQVGFESTGSGVAVGVLAAAAAAGALYWWRPDLARRAAAGVSSGAGSALARIRRLAGG